MRISTITLALFALCLLPAASRAQAVIDLTRGGTETREEVISSRALGFDYQLKARPGQTVTIKLEAQGAAFILSYETEGDQPVVLARNAAIWTGKLPRSGLEQRGIATYDISVNPRTKRLRGDVRFRLTVTAK
jgi:hypothetical protein